MFTKKPLGGFSCASCEKNIVNLEGLQAEFLSWRRLPFKENHERIAKVSLKSITVLLVWCWFLKDSSESET
jgi:hypothetical protein